MAPPLSKPVLFALALYIFIGSRNPFQWPLIVTTSHRVQPLEVEVSRLMTQQNLYRYLLTGSVVICARRIHQNISFNGYVPHRST